MFFKPAEKKTFGTRPAPENAATAPAPAPAPVADINTMMRNLILTVTALRDVLIRENEALDQSNSRAFLALQDEKVAVARRYEGLMMNLMDRSDIKSADPKLKQQLLAMEQGFSGVMKENLTKLTHMKNATEKLGERIMKSARKSADSVGQFAYGASGTMQKGVTTTIGVSEQA